MPSTQVNFTIMVDTDSINPNALPALMDELGDLEPMLLDIVATYWQEQEQAVFDTQGASVGDPWAPLKPSTLKEKARKGFSDQPLVREGHLAAAIGQSIVLAGNTVIVGFDTGEVPYGAIHDFGGGHVPQRILITTTDDQVERLMQRLQDYLSTQTGLGADVIHLSEGY